MTDFHLFHHVHPPAPDQRIDQVVDALRHVIAGLGEIQLEIRSNQEKIMATFADIQLAIAQQQTVEQGVVALLQQLSTQLAAAIAAEDPAAIQGVLDMLNANTKTLSDAVLANTPSAIGSATLATPIPSINAPTTPPPATETTPADNASNQPAPASGANAGDMGAETPPPPSNPAPHTDEPTPPSVPTAAPNTVG